MRLKSNIFFYYNHKCNNAGVPTVTDLHSGFVAVIAPNTCVFLVSVHAALASKNQHVYHVCIVHSVAMATWLMLGPAGTTLPSNS